MGESPKRVETTGEAGKIEGFASVGERLKSQ
jgi:hypothetical protein